MFMVDNMNPKQRIWLARTPGYNAAKLELNGPQLFVSNFTSEKSALLIPCFMHSKQGSYCLTIIKFGINLDASCKNAHIHNKQFM